MINGPFKDFPKGIKAVVVLQIIVEFIPNLFKCDPGEEIKWRKKGN